MPQYETIETSLGCRAAVPGPARLAPSSSTRFDPDAAEPVLLEEPPAPPAFDANAQLPSIASLVLGAGAQGVDPVEHKLPADPLLPQHLDPQSSLAQHIEADRKRQLAYSYPPPPAVNGHDGSDAELPYPTSTPHLTRAPVEIATRDPAVGRGVFATSDIPAGEVVEISPVLVLGEDEYTGRRKGDPDAAADGQLRGVEASQLRGYVFTWGRDGSMAVALGLGKRPPPVKVRQIRPGP